MSSPLSGDDSVQKRPITLWYYSFPSFPLCFIRISRHQQPARPRSSYSDRFFQTRRATMSAILVWIAGFVADHWCSGQSRSTRLQFLQHLHGPRCTSWEQAYKLTKYYRPGTTDRSLARLQAVNLQTRLHISLVADHLEPRRSAFSAFGGKFFASPWIYARVLQSRGTIRLLEMSM